MSATRAILAALAASAALSAPSRATAQYCGPDAVVCDECEQRTLGHAFLMLLNARLNEGVLDASPSEPVPGLQLHLDYSSAPPPSGSFVKLPNAWRVEGADAYNRLPVGAMEWESYWGPFGVRVRLHEFNNDAVQLGFSCNPVEYGGALQAGALELVSLIRADGGSNLKLAGILHIEFEIPQVCTPEVDVPRVCVPEICTPRVCVFGHCTPRWCTPEVCTPAFTIPQVCTPEIGFSATVTSPDVGLNLNDFHFHAAVVPTVSADGSSVDLAVYLDVSEATDQLAEHAANAAGMLASGIAAGACAVTIASPICYPIAMPLAWIIVESAVEDPIRRLMDSKARDAIQDKFSKLNEPPYEECTADASVCRCGSVCTPEDGKSVCRYPSAGNQWLRLAACKFEERVNRLGLPQEVLDLDVPNFDDVVPFDPPFAPTCEQ